MKYYQLLLFGAHESYFHGEPENIEMVANAILIRQARNGMGPRMRPQILD
jgi:hypothetical protein